MKFALASLLALIAAAAPALALASRQPSKAAPHLAHMVFFTMKDKSPEAIARFVASCDKYLAGHEGTVSYSVGTIARDVVEPVSDRDFDVALHLVFVDKAAGDAYQKSAKHVQFVDENKADFAKVRVFDSYLAAAPK